MRAGATIASVRIARDCDADPMQPQPRDLPDDTCERDARANVRLHGRSAIVAIVLPAPVKAAFTIP